MRSLEDLGAILKSSTYSHRETTAGHNLSLPKMQSCPPSGLEKSLHECAVRVSSAPCGTTRQEQRKARRGSGRKKRENAKDIK